MLPLCGEMYGGGGDKMVGDFECQKITIENYSDSMSTWGMKTGMKMDPMKTLTKKGYENAYENGV